MSAYTYGSLFSGAGILDYGLHRSIPELEPLFAVEVNVDRRRLFGAHFPGAKLFGDIATMGPAGLPEVAGLVGGIPCNTHSTGNTSGERLLAPQWSHAKRLIEHIKPAWTLWESSAKDRSWARWVPAVRRDLWRLEHASVSFRVRTRHRGAPHDRERAFVISWATTPDADPHGESPRAVHEALASLCEAPARVWNGRIPARARGRLDDGVEQRLAEAIGLGVDQRTASDAAHVLGRLIPTLPEE